MSSELLRRAAALMRERAVDAAVSAPSPWFVSEFEIVTDDQEPIETLSVLTGALHWRDAAAQRAHVASWHPDVALAVADSLDATAEVVDRLLSEKRWPKGKVEFGARHQLAVARAYLGESA